MLLRLHNFLSMLQRNVKLNLFYLDRIMSPWFSLHQSFRETDLRGEPLEGEGGGCGDQAGQEGHQAPAG